METKMKENENGAVPLAELLPEGGEVEEIINIPTTKEDRLKQFLAMIGPLQQGLRIELKVFKKVYPDGNVGAGAEWAALE